MGLYLALSTQNSEDHERLSMPQRKRIKSQWKKPEAVEITFKRLRKTIAEKYIKTPDTTDYAGFICLLRGCSLKLRESSNGVYSAELSCCSSRTDDFFSGTHQPQPRSELWLSSSVGTRFGKCLVRPRQSSVSSVM